MLFKLRRRRFRNRFFTFLVILSLFFTISLIIPSDPIIAAFTGRTDNNPRLYCVILLTHPTHEKYVHVNNITWGKNCHRTGIVRYTRSKIADTDFAGSGSSYYVNLWERILIAIRRSVSSYEYISNNDTLVIVPAATFVFREKLSSLLRTFDNNLQSPLVIIHEQQEENAYIFNGQALDLARNTKLIDSCLQKSYPSARETHLWTCIKKTLINQHMNSKCKNDNSESNDCFIHYYRNQLTLAHIKNGFCLTNNFSMCQSIVLVYPATLNDMVTLEFFKYRLKPRPTHNVL